ncbi:MAG TPA: rhodanese-like domain-containing protein [Clostridiales bacterium]|nr:rhodanese-like domain-containing protein [Clostridiales bacterium]
MSIFRRAKNADINEGVKTAGTTKGSLLIDVRSEQEYAEGHIPGSINIPAERLSLMEKQTPDKTTPLFLYCRTGARSARGAKLLKKAGYHQVLDIGGIHGWRGKTEKGPVT